MEGRRPRRPFKLSVRTTVNQKREEVKEAIRTKVVQLQLITFVQIF